MEDIPHDLLCRYFTRYELVDASSEAEAKQLGQALLPSQVHTVRPATQEEIDLMAWHNEMVRRESER